MSTGCISTDTPNEHAERPGMKSPQI